MPTSITENISELHASLSDYIEATYHISNPDLVKQRRELLKAIGVIHQEAFIESTPRYVSGDKFNTIQNLPESVLKLFNSLASPTETSRRLIYDPPYKHQLEAVDGILVKKKNLMIMTGTGSGKTESFLLPILGKLVIEASQNSASFATTEAVRALILYPMNALVNDQLGRVRNLFRDDRLKSIFKTYSARIPTFARYTSRTPYPGIRDPKKDQSRLKSFEQFYVEIEQAVSSTESDKREAAIKLMSELKAKGKWPAKPSLSKWYGGKGARWQDSEGNYQRAITLAEDSELITRQEVQASPPDLLITNYSMLEYMLMRPIERTIFEKTLKWLKDNPQEKFLIVIDEAHLYRGASGAEVGLLLRRLRERLEISPERFQVICATASFEDKKYSLEFASQLCGVEAKSFIPITGNFDFKNILAKGSVRDAEILANIDLDSFYSAVGDDRIKYVTPFLDFLGKQFDRDIEFSLYQALKDYGPLNDLINVTMGQAKPINELGKEIFNTDKEISDQALTVLLAFGSIAKQSKDDAGLLPCRIHTFFRGLPGLWICIDPQCTSLNPEHKSGFCGKLYSQPREHCECGGRVFELYTCRNCGTAYARAYTDDIENPSSLWSDQGKNIRLSSSQIKDFYPIDLLLETPTNEEDAEPSYLDIKTGRLNPNNLGNNYRKVYIRRERITVPINFSEQEDSGDNEETLGRFTTCSVCNKDGGRRDSAVQDHQTKGDQPFLALLTRQIQIQPPNSSAPNRFSPLRGRKILIFSDSRQIAAKLAPNLQTYSLRDALRPLLIWGFKTLQQNQYVVQDLCLDDSYFAILIASNNFDIRLRPELKPSDNFNNIDQQIRKEIKKGILNDELGFYRLFVKHRGEKAPESLLKEIVNTLSDRFTGVEALALAAISIKEEYHETIKALPNIPSIAGTDQSKIALANYWVRCWQSSGYWLKDMPDSWWKPTETNSKEGVKGHASGKFRKVTKLINSKQSEKIFIDRWLPELRKLTDDLNGTFRFSGKRLTLDFDQDWIRCKTCSSVHKAIPDITKCLDCGSVDTLILDPEKDTVFVARKGYYRNSVKGILADPPNLPMALIAAEHTAQLNAPQSEDVFSQAEENELLFQDIDIEWPLGQGNSSAIDILSSTTTMEVGIDIGALSGVALRNMPPGRANYQQRAGRAGRRGNAVATVVAFGSVDSHDEHFFSHPKEMISGPVVDPIITLNNIDIVKRHVRAFLLQKYHQVRLPEFIPSHHDANLFSVLGSVQEFIHGNAVINRNDFKAWLSKNENFLKERILSWIPIQLGSGDRMKIANEAIIDCLSAVDDAIDFETNTTESKILEYTNTGSETDAIEPSEEEDLGKENLSDGLLDRLLYRGKLPRYAFPTDVATFHVFDRNRSTSFKTIMRFAPSQGLPIALTQYAPDRQVWISNKCYTSGAIYSPIRGELYEAWAKRRLYYECTNCGFAKTEPYRAERKREIIECEACGHQMPEPFNWLRPPGFAHPVDVPEETSPDGMPEVGYATRAKLNLPYSTAKKWQKINDRVLGLKVRTHLLVSNTGPNKDGYVYCVKCGKIEAMANSTGQFGEQHTKPYPDEEPLCEGRATSKIVLGTDFITDVALFSIDLSPHIKLPPGSYTYDVALRTLCEALSKAASQMLEIEPNDIVAEYRPALTLNSKGKHGEQVEVFLYDTLPGGAGFSPQLIDKGKELFEKALYIMESCKENCDASCYRCLRIFRNKFEHKFLDRHVGIQLAKFILTGQLPILETMRIKKAMSLLLEDLLRTAHMGTSFHFGMTGDNVENFETINTTSNTDINTIIAIASPLTPTVPINHSAKKHAEDKKSSFTVIPVDEFLIRNNLPSATKLILEMVE